MAAAGGAAAPTAGAKLGPCPKHVRPRRLRCGTLDVPSSAPTRRWARSRSATRSAAERHRQAPGGRPIFAVEGGPGYGSIGSARYYVHMFGPAAPRATTWSWSTCAAPGTRGRSTARSCRRDAAPTARASRNARGSLGDRYGSYRTSAAADDIDAVRAALGYERISLYGDSYGTFLGQSYAFRHGDTLAALILDSAYPVRGESPWYPSLWRNGIRALQIACDRTRRLRGQRQRAACGASSRCCGARPAASARCSTRSPPAATSRRCATSSRST